MAYTATQSVRMVPAMTKIRNLERNPARIVTNVSDSGRAPGPTAGRSRPGSFPTAL